MPTILLVRHSNTTYDKKVDALLDPPLDEEGIKRLEGTIQFINQLPYEIDRIVSSPLQRTLLTASLIAKNNHRVTTNKGALPWNLGDLMGKSGKEVGERIEFLHNYPDLKPPHGETYRTFYERWKAFLELVQEYAEIKEDKAIIITTHSRNINALQSIVGGAPIGDVQEKTPEASVTLLAKTGSNDWDYELIWDGK